MYARTNINPHPVSDRPCITADNDDSAPNKKPLSEKVTMYAASRSREKATILPRTSAEAMEERSSESTRYDWEIAKVDVATGSRP